MWDALLDKSLVGYTALGYRWRPHPPVSVDLTGKSALVTGATSGLGKATATALASLGASVTIVGRDPEKTSRVRTEMFRRTGNEAIAVEIADLSIMNEVRALASRFRGPLHLLVNNAGVMLRERQVTSEGLEATFATNLLGHFVLTRALMPRLRASAPARIVNVSSGGMYTQRLRLDDLQMSKGTYDGTAAYAHTKRAQVILTEQWADQLRGSGVTVHAMHPGWADTQGVADSLPRFHTLMKPLLRTPAEGADTIVWLCTSPEAAETTGLFWHDRRPRPTHRSRRTQATPQDRDSLEDTLESLAPAAADAQDTTGW
ncbi:MAG: SDR family NAD(P)-dependent oxidoreductase [Polyangiales bacterium]